LSVAKHWLGQSTVKARITTPHGHKRKPVLCYRQSSLEPASQHWQLQAMNDQHAYLHIAAEDDLHVGDLIGFGVSHPCTSFDKWRLFWVIDEQYNVISAIRTFF